MISILESSAFIVSGILLYIYIGYPLLLFVLRYLLSEKKINKEEILPEVTLMISCFNEEKVIREKLENALDLDYPEDRLEIIVVSDASTDSTDEIVREYKDRGVGLIRQDKNLGKTAGLNLAVPKTTGEIIVFSDANAIYQKDAIRKLVRNFNDEKVGYVVGEARYKDVDQTAASKSESTYWKFEILLKRMESYIHSVVGGDGAIYAIRRELYEDMLDTDINDFVNPLQIILKGFRGIYESEAICWEETAGDFRKEFQRKIRIINRSFSGLMRMKSVMNPFKTGFFSIGIISHKLLRWLAPLFVIIFVILSGMLSLLNIHLFQWISLMLTLFFIFSYVGYVLAREYDVWLFFYYPYYFVLVSIASITGLYKSARGEIQTTWSPIRVIDSDAKESYTWKRSLIHICFIIVVWFFLKTSEVLFAIPLMSDKVVYWASLSVLFYVYLGYPFVLLLLSNHYQKTIIAEECVPEVTLLICAYNEEEIIESKIKNSLAIEYPDDKFRIVIASDGSTDQTNEIVRRHENRSLILMDYPERRGKVSVINDTVPKLESEIIIFSDANTMYQKDAIKKLVRNFSDPSVGAVSADVILHSEETTFGKSESLYYLYERWIQKKESDFGSLIGADGGMYAIRKKLFIPPSPNIILDDFVISMNTTLQGYRLVYEGEAIGHEKSTISYKAEFLRKSRVIAGAIQSIMQKEGIPSIKQKGLFFCYVSHKFLRWMIPLILVIVFLFNLRLVFLSGGTVYIVILIVQLLVYVLAIADLFIIKKYRISLTSVPFYFCLVNSAALYGIYKGLFKKQPVKWQKFDRELGAV